MCFTPSYLSTTSEDVKEGVYHKYTYKDTIIIYDSPLLTLRQRRKIERRGITQISAKRYNQYLCYALLSKLSYAKFYILPNSVTQINQLEVLLRNRLPSNRCQLRMSPFIRALLHNVSPQNGDSCVTGPLQTSTGCRSGTINAPGIVHHMQKPEPAGSGILNQRMVTRQSLQHRRLWLLHLYISIVGILSKFGRDSLHQEVSG